jgi:hypothetical protein
MNQPPQVYGRAAVVGKVQKGRLLAARPAG